jgi:hypothetical protein
MLKNILHDAKPAARSCIFLFYFIFFSFLFFSFLFFSFLFFSFLFFSFLFFSFLFFSFLFFFSLLFYVMFLKSSTLECNYCRDGLCTSDCFCPLTPSPPNLEPIYQRYSIDCKDKGKYKWRAREGEGEREGRE